MTLAPGAGGFCGLYGKHRSMTQTAIPFLFMRGGTMPLRHDKLARLAAVDADTWAEIWAELEPFFEVRESAGNATASLSHKRIRKDLQHLENLQRAGKKGAKARWEKQKGKAEKPKENKPVDATASKPQKKSHQEGISERNGNGNGKGKKEEAAPYQPLLADKGAASAVRDTLSPNLQAAARAATSDPKGSPGSRLPRSYMPTPPSQQFAKSHQAADDPWDIPENLDRRAKK